MVSLHSSQGVYFMGTASLCSLRVNILPVPHRTLVLCQPETIRALEGGMGNEERGNEEMVLNRGYREPVPTQLP